MPTILLLCVKFKFGGNLPLLNTRTFDFSALTLSFHFFQKSLKTFNWFCISSFDSDIITVSSAYKSTKSFKYTSSSISKSSVIDVRPLTFLEKAFDKVRRDGLWCKLLLDNINGKMYKVIYNMYQNMSAILL
jgi:hypothetical protein